MGKAKRRDFLWIVLFLIVFINGFEAGGYQASLWSIGKDFDLSMTSMGLYAAMELFATMLAPILLGRWADSVEKSKSIGIMLGIQIVAAILVLFTASDIVFLGGVFFLGLTTSALQFIAIAALADAYPVSGGRKVAYMTSMYATGFTGGRCSGSSRPGASCASPGSLPAAASPGRKSPRRTHFRRARVPSFSRRSCFSG